ncbi:hypothetical protein HDR58_03855 [bacterium]|nr:hypothetical protein [bacterium]
MKKIYLIALISLLFIGTQVCFGVVTTTRKSSPNTSQNKTQETKQVTTVQRKSTGSKLSDSVKMCKPYSESLGADFMGMNISYQVSIEGWINNKCRLNFIAQTNGTSQSFEQLYGISPEDAIVSSFVPKIRCEFTKQQLDYVGDSILQEQERNSGKRNNMLKDPNSISISSLSPSDGKLLDVVMNQGACQILNSGDLNKMLDSLLQF